LVWAAIYNATDYEPLNTGTPVLFLKGFLILLILLYNSKKIITGYRSKDYVAVFGFLIISITLGILIILPSGGGR
jgi:hypothetical protein